MVAGLKFLSKKSFNPQNLVNQKSVWEREQESNREAARFRERERQLTIERDHEELAKSRDGASGGHKAALRFMYDAPPGLDQNKSGADDLDGDDGKVRAAKSEGADASTISFERKSGDDDAAAAFRRMLAGASSQTEEVSQHHGGGLSAALDEAFQSNDPSSSSLIISGSMAEANVADRSQLSQLEKAVGKRNGTSALTYDEQISRFPQLRNAPMALTRKGGDNGGDDDVVKTNMNFKPLGAQIRNVKCLACKIWGHSRGDRECKLSGWDPFSSSSIGGGANASGADGRPSSSIMPDSSRRKDDADEKYGYYGPTGHKRTDGHDDDRDSGDESRDSRDRQRRKKKSKRRKESRRDRDDRKYSKRRRRSHEKYDNDSFSDQRSYSSDESRRGRKRDRKTRKHKSRRRSRSRSPNT